MAHYAIVVDLDRCIGCHGCEIACKNENNIALGEYWNKVVERGLFGEYPDLEMYFLPTMCQQCQDAPCVNVCPTGASYRDADGMVLVDKEKCIGCKYCMMACPYGVRSWNAAESVVEKCTLCAHLSKNGELPMCVRTCSRDAVPDCSPARPSMNFAEARRRRCACRHARWRWRCWWWAASRRLRTCRTSIA